MSSVGNYTTTNQFIHIHNPLHPTLTEIIFLKGQPLMMDTEPEVIVKEQKTCQCNVQDQDHDHDKRKTVLFFLGSIFLTGFLVGAIVINKWHGMNNIVKQ